MILSPNSLEVLNRRYLLKDAKQRIIETPLALFRRVARHVASAEKRYPSRLRQADIEEIFFRMLRDLEFLPNSPTLMNAGTPMGQLSACFVLPVNDSIEEIFEPVRNMARIHQTGGGTGFDFSQLRPKGDLIGSTMAAASGPVSFLGIFDKTTEVIVQGGRRRGANMGILRCDHPDITDFVREKTRGRAWSNFNISVGVTDKFMAAVKAGLSFGLINPRTRKESGRLNAKELFDLIVDSAWRTGDPGLIFLDEINRRNPLRLLGRIAATNPCGELPLLPYESCNLGSLNLAKMVKDGTIDWQALADRIYWAVRFLDNVIDVNRFPLPQIRAITYASRKIGLGVMGFADMLIELGIPYDSAAAVRTAEGLMRFIRRESLAASAELAQERGVFPHHPKSTYAARGLRLRNATVNSIAPTGTISIIAGCSSGIEPLFGVSFLRNVLSGTELYELNPRFAEELRRRGIYDRKLLDRISRARSLRAISKVPDDLKKIFVTAFDVSRRQHLLIQAAFQKYTDNAVSKTINLAHEASRQDVADIYLLAHRLRCKGITIYRYGSKREQVLSYGRSCCVALPRRG